MGIERDDAGGTRKGEIKRILHVTLWRAALSQIHGELLNSLKHKGTMVKLQIICITLEVRVKDGLCIF